MLNRNYEMDFLPGIGDVELRKSEPKSLIVDDRGLRLFLFDPQAFQIYLQDKRKLPNLPSNEVKAETMRKFLHDYRLAVGLSETPPSFPSQKELPSEVTRRCLESFLTNNCELRRTVTPLECRYLVPGVNFEFVVKIDDYRQYQPALMMLVEPKVSSLHPEGLHGFRLGMAVLSHDLYQDFLAHKLTLCVWSVATKLRFSLDQFDPDLIREIAFHLGRAMALGYGIDLESQNLTKTEILRRQQVLANAATFFDHKAGVEEIMVVGKQDFNTACSLMEKLRGNFGCSTWHKKEAIPQMSRKSRKSWRLRPVIYDID